MPPILAPMTRRGGACPLGGDLGQASRACHLLVLEGLGEDHGAAGYEATLCKQSRCFWLG